MESFKFSLYVCPFESKSRRFDLLLSLTKSFKPSKRISTEWTFTKVYDEYIYVYAKYGFIFKMVCKEKSGHLYFSHFYIYMYDEETDVIYDDDKIEDFSLYVYNTDKKSMLPIVCVDKNMPETAFNFLKLV